MNSELQKELERIAATIDPKKEAIVYHVGRRTADGNIAEEQRFQPDTDLPLIDVIPKRNIQERAYFGWKHYPVEIKPTGIKPSTSSTGTTSSKAKSTSARKSTTIKKEAK